MTWRFATLTDRETVVEAIVDAAERACLALTPESGVTPVALQRADGSSRLRPVGSTAFTSQHLWEAEERLLNLARDTNAPAVDPQIVRAAIDHAGQDGVRASTDQVQAVEAIAASGYAIDLLIGPAGAGKTTTMAILRHAWEHAHGTRNVVGLAPSAAAAHVLGEELGICTENTAKWLADRAHGKAAFTKGQLVIVDEATLAGTFALDRIAQAAASAGAKVLLVGDPAQLQSVQAGGAFAMLANGRPDAAQLVDIHRFRNPWENLASLELRHAHPEVIDIYAQHDRIREGDTQAMLDTAYQAWRHDTTSGLVSVLIAADRSTVTALNQRARTDRITAGHVHPGVEVTLEDGTRASRGDVITTRRNDRRLIAGRSGWVRNGDQWTVTRVHTDGAITVRRLRWRVGAAVILPATYVADHVNLGYATSAHRAQGLTVDTAHVLAGPATTREALYVAMTRGRHANTAYVATDQADPTHAALFPNDTRPTGTAILRAVLQTSGTEPAAHTAATQEHETWRSIAQLTAEYETIAAAALRDHYAHLIHHAGIDPEVAEQITA
ncbi:MAG: AAA family ATPase, partial [Bifidobacteriaceae bacterium]|nr:AAA family ATPase [Bifidobacteriaceae bacterium]